MSTANLQVVNETADRRRLQRLLKISEQPAGSELLYPRVYMGVNNDWSFSYCSCREIFMGSLRGELNRRTTLPDVFQVKFFISDWTLSPARKEVSKFYRVFVPGTEQEKMREYLERVVSAATLLLFGKPTTVEYVLRLPTGTYWVNFPGEILNRTIYVHFLLGLVRESITLASKGKLTVRPNGELERIRNGCNITAWRVMYKVFTAFREAGYYTRKEHLLLFWALSRWGTKSVLGEQDFRWGWDLTRGPDGRLIYNHGQAWWWGQHHLNCLLPEYRAEAERICDSLEVGS